MSGSHPNRATYHCYPFLNNEEFAEVCHHLDNKYCQATLGPIRRHWRLQVHRALDVSFGTNSDYTTFLQISRPLESTAGLGDLEAFLEDFSMGEINESTKDTLDAMEIEEEDQVRCLIRPVLGRDSSANTYQELLLKQPSRSSFGRVIYEIHLHPTYRAPCLWFSLHDLPADEPTFDIDTVFRRLIPDQFKDALRGVGPIGGISADVSSSS
jgi:ubiquitin-like-conjugating enzyme ATG10